MVISKLVRRLITLGIVLAILIPAAVYVVRGYLDLTLRVDYSYLFGEITDIKVSKFESISIDGISIPEMSAVAETDTLALFIDESTTGIAVYDKRSGGIWYSIPPDAFEDEIANQYHKEYMASALFLEFFNPERLQLTRMSYTDSVLHEQFDLYSIPDGIRIEYRIGDAPSLRSKMPIYITAERLEEAVLGRIDAREARALRRYYAEAPDKPGFMQILGGYLNSTVALQRILDAFEEAGYSEEDLRIDDEAAGIAYVSEEDYKYIMIPVDYYLRDDKLIVHVDTALIEEPDEMQLFRMELLKFFGAGSSDEKGYLFVPSGSGALINFQNDKSAYGAYSQPVYGGNLLEQAIILQQIEPVRMPVFGVKKEYGAILAHISKGAGSVIVNADVAGKFNSYNCTYPTFVFRAWDDVFVASNELEASAQLAMTIVQKDKYDGPIEIAYCFLPGAGDGYEQMAAYYRNLLQSEDKLPHDNVNKSGKIPFYTDILGAVEREVNYVGIPVYTNVTMTTAQQAGKITEALTDAGVDNIQMRYLGWFNGGINHWAPKNIRPIRNTGGIKALQNLYNDLEDNGGSLYLDATFVFSPARRRNFNVPNEAARELNGFPAMHAIERNRVTLRRGSFYWENFAYINSPRIIPDYIERFSERYNKWGFDTLSVRDMGNVLSADLNQRYNLSREHTKIIFEQQLSKINDNYSSFLIDGGNEYALRHTSGITGAPVSATMFYIFDMEVPFYQMVLHGLVPYAGQPVNLSNNTDNEYELRMAEFNAAPYFLWSYNETTELRWTGYNRFYSTGYTDWINEATQMYKRLAAVNQQVMNARMTGYIVHDNGIRETQYDNNISVYVNYNYEDTDINGVTIPARGYVTGGSAS